MERYAVYAYEGKYGGLHGINSKFIVEGTYSDAIDAAQDQSLNLMEEYADIYTDFEMQAKRDGLIPRTAEYDEYIQDCYDENIAYEMKKVRDDVDIPSDELEEEFYNMDHNTFFDEYCEDEWL